MRVTFSVFIGEFRRLLSLLFVAFVLFRFREPPCSVRALLDPFAVSVVRLRISFAAFFLTDFQSARYRKTEHWISNATLATNVNFQHWWVNWTHHNDTERHLLFPPDEFREIQSLRPLTDSTSLPRDADLAAKFFFSLRFFLQNTTGRWFYRGTDDSLINFARLGPFLAELEKRYNPFTEFVFLANCISDQPYTFPQGGSGYLISRSAAELLEPLSRLFLRTLTAAEDMAFQGFLESLNVSMLSTVSPFFSGLSFGEQNLGWIRRGEWEQFPNCPPQETRTPNAWGLFLSPIRDIVFYHEWQGEFDKTQDNAKAVFAADPRIMWYTNAPSPHVCKLAQ
jgi:hypothetical protein